MRKDRGAPQAKSAVNVSHNKTHEGEAMRKYGQDDVESRVLGRQAPVAEATKDNVGQERREAT